MILELSVSTTEKHFAILKQLGWIRQTDTNYQVVSMYKLASSKEKSKRVKLFELSDNDLFELSWKNISSFKAILAEMRFEQYSDYQNYCNKKKEKEILTKNTEGFLKPKLSHLASYKSRVRKLNDKYFALSLSSVIIGKSISTIASYRKKVEPMGFYKTFKPKPVKKSLKNQIDSISGYDVISNLNAVSSENRNQVGVTCKKTFGHYYYNNGTVLFQQCSRRIETSYLKKCFNNCYRFVPIVPSLIQSLPNP